MRRRWLALMIASGASACRLGFDARVAGDGALGAFSIGGTVTGLAGAGLVLHLDGGDDLAPAMDGPFEFATPITSGQAYGVTILAQPAGGACSIANASGIVAAGPVTNVEVVCFAAGSCPASPVMFTGNGSFTVPEGCTTLTVEAFGGGGAGGAKNQGQAAAAGGNGGHAVKTLTGQAAGTVVTITIGLGGTCASRAATAGGYAGGGGGKSSGFGDGEDGAGTTAPPGGLGGAGSTGSQPGGAGGDGGFGGGGGGGGGDAKEGNSGGGATTVRIASTDYVVAGGGGGAGTADQNGDVSGPGGAACEGYDGANGVAAIAGTRSGGGGGGGACYCIGGCDAIPTPTGGVGGSAGTSGTCAGAQDGVPGRVVLSFP